MASVPVPHERVDAAVARLAAKGIAAPRLSHYYRVHADAVGLAALARDLRALPHVQAAYVKPAAEPAGLNDMQPKAGPAPAATPDFSARQAYLDVAPGGVDASAVPRLTGVR